MIMIFISNVKVIHYKYIVILSYLLYRDDFLSVLNVVHLKSLLIHYLGCIIMIIISNLIVNHKNSPLMTH